MPSVKLLMQPRMKFEFWGGPADGLTIHLSPELIYLEYIYVSLPARNGARADKLPPNPPYAIYRVGTPKPHLCQWVKDVLK